MLSADSASGMASMRCHVRLPFHQARHMASASPTKTGSSTAHARDRPATPPERRPAPRTRAHARRPRTPTSEGRRPARRDARRRGGAGGPAGAGGGGGGGPPAGGGGGAGAGASQKKRGID